MSATIKLSKEQIEDLDLLIAAKKVKPDFINIPQIIAVLVQVLVNVTVGAAETGLSAEHYTKYQHAIKNVTVDQLIDIRKKVTEG